MKKEIDLNEWIRKEQFAFFSKFEEPFFELTVLIDCTIAYTTAKQKSSLFSCITYIEL